GAAGAGQEGQGSGGAVAPQGRAVLAADALLAGLDVALLEQCPPHQPHASGQVERVVVVDQVAGDLRQRGGVGADAVLAVGQALGDGQAPALVQRGIEAKATVAVQPVQLVVGDAGQVDDSAAHQRVAAQLLLQVAGQPAGGTGQHQGRH